MSTQDASTSNVDREKRLVDAPFQSKNAVLGFVFGVSSFNSTILIKFSY